MVVFSKVATALAGVSLVAAAPAQQSTARSSTNFSLNQIARSGTKASFASQYAHALTKHGKPVPENLRKAAQRASLPKIGGVVSGATDDPSGKNASDTTTPVEDDELYVTPINVGGNVLNLDIDTGSADL